jgi:hypothetical protein
LCLVVLQFSHLSSHRQLLSSPSTEP